MLACVCVHLCVCGCIFLELKKHMSGEILLWMSIHEESDECMPQQSDKPREKRKLGRDSGAALTIRTVNADTGLVQRASNGIQKDDEPSSHLHPLFWQLDVCV